MPRSRREVELPDFLAACRRMLRAAGRRTGSADPEDLAALIALRAELDDVIGEAVGAMRSRVTPYSWAEIARATGTSRQAAQQRWGTSQAHPAEAVDEAQLTVDDALAVLAARP